MSLKQENDMSIINRKGASAYNLECKCPICELSKKVRHREFSAQAWSFLVVSGEIQADAVGDALCEDCYKDMREYLIDSFTEVETISVLPDLEQRLISVRRNTAQNL